VQAPEITAIPAVQVEKKNGKLIEGARAGAVGASEDSELAAQLESHSLESIVEIKISRFLDQIGDYYPENLHALMMRKVERPLVAQILQRTGGNQVQAAKILGINRNTLRKKMKIYSLYS
jgi:Fis family transcriptional regulator, factor for inversion stimulation protein